MILLIISSAVIICSIVINRFIRSNHSINGIYAKPGQYFVLKFVLFYILLTIRKIRPKQQKDGLDNDNGNCKTSLSERHQKMELPQPFSTSKEAFDAVFFSGASSNGTYLIVATERRPNNLTYAILYVMLPGKGMWKGDWLPKTAVTRNESLYNKSYEEGYDRIDTSFEGDGIKLTPLEPMRKWRIQFNGKLRNLEGNISNVKLDLMWRSDEGIFNYDTDMSPYAAARAFAKEVWNKQYFKDLEKAHQTHYEQMGRIDGELEFYHDKKDDDINMGGKNIEKIALQMPSFRDHSYGYERDWKLMHRYIFHHIFMEDGTKAVVGIVCEPSICSNLECGFVSLRGGRQYPVESCTLNLRELGEGGTPSSDYGFEFMAGGQEFQIQCKVVFQCPPHYLGKEYEAKNIEHFMEYSVNGETRGYGICEWNYRNTKEIPKHELSYIEKVTKLV